MSIVAFTPKKSKARVIAFTGAGISKDSGIDTFQDRPGIRDKLTRSYASRHPEKYREVMREFCNSVKGKLPNDAHKALVDYDIPVITMNVDGLHRVAGTKVLIELHGRLPDDSELEYCDTLYNTPVLYGDIAPEYNKAFDMVDTLTVGDIFLVIGASDYTKVSSHLKMMAACLGATVIEIQREAFKNVRECLERIASGEDVKNFQEDYI